MPLTEKQKRFGDEYLVDFNATQAYKRAGYSVKSDAVAAVEAHKLLRNPNIQEYIAGKQKELANKLNISQEKVLAEYAKIAFTDIRAFYNSDGRLKAMHELNDDAAAALAGVEVDELFAMSMDGKIQIGETKKIKRWDKVKALDSICKVLGYNSPEKHVGSLDINWTEEKTYASKP